MRISLLLVAVLAVGCGASRPRSEILADLQSASPDERRAAADDLRRHGGPAPEAVAHLLAALQKERNAHAYGAMIITLGKSGAAEAHPFICGAVHAGDEDMRRWGKNALRLWLQKNRASGGCPPPGTEVAVAVPVRPVPAAPAASAAEVAPPEGWEPVPTVAPTPPK